MPYLWQNACQNEKDDDERGDHACAHTSRVEESLTPSCQGENMLITSHHNHVKS